MKRFFYEHAGIIFAVTGLSLIVIQYVLATGIQNATLGWLVLIGAAIIQTGGGLLFGLLIERLHSLTNTDDLTGLNNRKKFHEELAHQAQLHERNNRELSLLAIDIDRFKSINDTYGHLVGDKVLVHISQVFQEELRAKDMVARVGGEEFAIILPHTNRHDAIKIAERIKDRVQNETFPYEDRDLSISVGVASMKGNESTRQLLQSADDALYLAKDTRNTVVAMS